MRKFLFILGFVFILMMGFASATVPMTDNILFLKFSAASQADALTDLSGNSYTITNVGSTSWYGNGFHFDGIDDEIVITNDAKLNVDDKDFVICSWVKYDETAVYSNRFIQKGTSSDGGWKLGRNLGDNTDFLAGTANDIFLRDNAADTDTIHKRLLCAVIDRSSATSSKLYMDGTAISAYSHQATSSTSYSNTEDVRIGYGESYYFAGNVTAVYIWKGTNIADDFTASTITEIYNNGDTWNPYINSFELTASNLFNGSAIDTFTADLTNTSGTTTVSTTNGSIFFTQQDELVDIKVYNVTGTEGVYFNKSYSDYNTTANLDVALWQGKLIIDAYDALAQSDIANFNFTISDGVYVQFNTSNSTNKTTFLTNADSYSYTGKAEGFSNNQTGTVSVGSLESVEITVNFTLGGTNVYGPFNSSKVFNYVEFNSDCTSSTQIKVSRSTSSFQDITSGYNYTFNDLGKGFYAQIDSDSCSWIEITTKQLYTLNGTVKDKSGTGFAQAVVYAIRYESDDFYKNITDDNGIFSIPVPWTGNYTVVGIKNSTLAPDADTFIEIIG